MGALGTRYNLEAGQATRESVLCVCVCVCGVCVCVTSMSYCMSIISSFVLNVCLQPLQPFTVAGTTPSDASSASQYPRSSGPPGKRGVAPESTRRIMHQAQSISSAAESRTVSTNKALTSALSKRPLLNPPSVPSSGITNRLATSGAGNRRPFSHTHRLAYAKMWVNSLGVSDPLPVEMDAAVSDRFKNGTLFCAILEACGEASRLGRTYRRPGIRATCLHNFEAVLAVLRLAGVPQRRLPTADELCNGNEKRISSVLVDLLDLYALRPARSHATAALAWLSGVLDAYGLRTSCLMRVTPGKPSATPDGLWMLIRDGAALALLAHYYGGDAATVGGGVNLSAVTLSPDCAAQRMTNLGIAAPVLAHLGVRFVINDDALAIAREDTKDPDVLDADDDVALLQVS
jgi:hypothetical protein